MAQLFDGITVLDFTQGMAGSIATMVMSDFGAEVIKLEPPGGDPFRHQPGAIQWNRGKKSVILDLKTAPGRQQVQRLARQADMVVENFRPGVTKRLGIDYETLGSGRRELVYCSLTGFGPKGPYAHYKGYEGVVAAKSGRMMVFAGQNNREGPNYGAVPVASHSAAMALVRGAVAALYVRDRTGQGQRVETSLLQTITPYDLRDWIIWQMMIQYPEDFPEDPWLRRGASAPGYVPVRTRDGQWFQLANTVERLFRTAIHSLDLGSIYEDPRFKAAPVLLQEDRDALRDIILRRVQEKNLDEWMDVFINQTANVAAEPYTTAQEGMSHPQLLHNGHVLEMDDPRVGRMRQIGPLVTMRENPGGPKGPASVPGQHTEEILARLGDGAMAAQSFSTGPLPKYPLEGITILNLSTVIAGPLACCLVAELGARVIRIEPLEGENGRLNQMGIAVHRTMAGNEGRCLDLKTTEGQDIIHKLVAKADVLLHSMRPGAPERLGISYEQVSKINPQMIYVYAAGYGSTGPHSHRPAMHPISGAVCGGALAQLGRDTLPSPGQILTLDEVREVSRKLNRANEPNPDPSSSMVHAAAMLFGLYARQRSGKGQYVESTMLMANAYANAEDFFQYDGKPARRLPDAEGYGTGALNRLYPAKGGWVFLACPFEQEWQDLCRTIERLDLLENPRFANSEAREAHDAALAEELGMVFPTREPLVWEALLTAADVACVKAEDRGPFHFYDEDAHVRENEFTIQVETSRLGKFWRYSPLLRFSHTRDKAEPGMLKGQHTKAILRELGYSREQVNALREQGVVDWEEA